MSNKTTVYLYLAYGGWVQFEQEQPNLHVPTYKFETFFSSRKRVTHKIVTFPDGTIRQFVVPHILSLFTLPPRQLPPPQRPPSTQQWKMGREMNHVFATHLKCHFCDSLTSIILQYITTSKRTMKKNRKKSHIKEQQIVTKIQEMR